MIAHICYRGLVCCERAVTFGLISLFPGPYQANLNSLPVETLKLVHHVLGVDNVCESLQSSDPMRGALIKVEVGRTVLAQWLLADALNGLAWKVSLD